MEPELRAAERLLIDALPDRAPANIVCTSLGRAQLAAEAARRFPASGVTCVFLDLYHAEQAQALHAGGPANLSIVCRAELADDPTRGPVELVALPVHRGGEAELCRDLLQAGHETLAIGGRLLTAVNNPADTWLHGEMRKLFEKVTCRRSDAGVVYAATKTGPLRKLKRFEAEFAFRDRGHLLRMVSRPGVFSHRRIDPGTRALLDAMEISTGERVLDIGCGAGALCLAAAVRAEAVAVHGIDSNPRAVECTRKSAALNGLNNLTAELDADIRCEPRAYDVVLMNPPYYSQHRLAELFLQGARRAIRPGGRIYVVTKSPQWYEERLPELFIQVELQPVRSYWVLRARGG